jgi:hypothetical protein
VIAGTDCVVIYHVAIDCETAVALARFVFETRNATRDARCARVRIIRL